MFSHRNISQSLTLSLSLSLITLKLLPYSLSHGYQTPVPFCLKPVLSDLLYSCTIISQTGTQFVPKLFASSFSNVSQTCTQYFFLNISQLPSSFSNTSQKLTQFFLIYLKQKYSSLSNTFQLLWSFSNISVTQVFLKHLPVFCFLKHLTHIIFKRLSTTFTQFWIRYLPNSYLVLTQLSLKRLPSCGCNIPNTYPTSPPLTSISKSYLVLAATFLRLTQHPHDLPNTP